MKTKEFIKQVEELGYVTITNDGTLQIYESSIDLNLGLNIAWFLKVDTKHMAIMNYNARFANIDAINLPKALKLAADYMLTPIEERKEETKFYVQLTPETRHCSPTWLIVAGEDEELTISDKATRRISKQVKICGQFTKSSYAKQIKNNLRWGPFLPDKYDKDNPIFVPVEDGEEND